MIKMTLDEWLGYPVLRHYKDLDLRLLPMNHAYVVINTTVDNVSVYGVDSDCFNCPYKHQATLIAGKEKSWMIDSRKEKYFRVELHKEHFVDSSDISPKHRQGWLCQSTIGFEEYGVYRFNIGNCELTNEVPPAKTYLPLLLCSAMFLGVYLICLVGNVLWNLKKKKQSYTYDEKMLEINIDETDNEQPSTLNIFRGILLSLIIFATTGGGGYSIFLQSENSNGVSFVECLYFAFAWSVGLNIPVFMSKAFNQMTKCRIVKDIFMRLLVLIFVDIAVSNGIHTTNDSTLVPEVIWHPLLRLGVSYFITASAYVFTVQRFEMKSKKIICKAINNLISLMWCWIVAGFLLALMVISISTLMSFNCLSNLKMTKAIDFSEKLEDESQNCNNELTLMANVYMVNRYQKVINVHSYLGFNQGVMGLMSTVMFTMIGLKAGIIYANYKSHSDRLKLWSVWAMMFGLGGVFFAAVSYPLEFNLWPIASILLISTIIMLSFAALYAICEVKKFNSYGLNSAGVTFFIILPAHMLLSHNLPFSFTEKLTLETNLSQHMVYIIKSYSIVLMWLVVGIMLMKKKLHFAL